jgi:mRNA deadenylase 3'-5' endonuclease subunit Ccr4
MVKLIELLINVVITNKRKMLVQRLNQNGMQQVSPLYPRVHGCNAAGEQKEPKSSDKLSTGNVVSP